MTYDKLDGEAMRHTVAAPDIATKAAKVACDRIALAATRELHLDPFHDADPGVRAEVVADSRLALEALGLIDYEAVDRAPFQGVDRFVHGSRSAVERHRAGRSALCGPCLRWTQVDARKQHRTGG
jgi:hypothetical protein